MKKIILGFMMGVMLSLSGCMLFDDFKEVDFNKVHVKNVSILDGITVEVNGVDCNFTFTTERETIFKEIKACLIEHAKYKATQLVGGAVPLPVATVIMSAPPITGPDGEVIYEDPVPYHNVDPVLINEAERATLEILGQIKQSE